LYVYGPAPVVVWVSQILRLQKLNFERAVRIANDVSECDLEWKSPAPRKK